MSVIKIPSYDNQKELLNNLSRFIFSVKDTCILTSEDIDNLIDSTFFSRLFTDVEIYEMGTFNQIRTLFWSEIHLCTVINGQIVHLYFRPYEDDKDVYLLFIKAFAVKNEFNGSLVLGVNNKKATPAMLAYNKNGVVNYMRYVDSSDSDGCYYYENDSLFVSNNYDTVSLKKYIKTNNRFCICMITYDYKKCIAADFYLNSKTISIEQLEVVIPDIRDYTTRKMTKLQNTITPEQLSLIEMINI